MDAKLTPSARRELACTLRARYQSAENLAKRKILAEFVAVTGYHPKSAIRVLNRDRESDGQPQHRRRPCLYDEATKQALIVLWEASDRVCGKRLKPLLRILVPSLERHGHLRLGDAIRANLLSMSAATIDRALRAPRSASKPKKRRVMMPEIRRRIAVRTFADWHEPPPGSMEMDLVAHCGGANRGSYVHSLVLTDIATAWTECTPLVVRERTLLVEALERVRVSLPFPLRSLDVDNGTEFINEDLVTYCVSHGIELTRSRPYRKNDQAWVEQKNGAVVRQMVGYRRLEGIAAAQMLARLYGSLRFFVNFFQPSFKLMEKSRSGSHVTKRYHPPLTPAEQLLMTEGLPAPMKVRLREVLEALDPLRLLEEIRAVQANLTVLADGGLPYEPQASAPDLSSFLATLSSAWRAGEVRPTHVQPGKTPIYLRKIQIVAPPPPPRVEPRPLPGPPPDAKPATTQLEQYQHRTNPRVPEPRRAGSEDLRGVQPLRRNRPRPFAFRLIWPVICKRLEAKPNLNASELFDQLRAEYPGRYNPGQANALGRLVRKWRAEAATRGIIARPLSYRKYGKPRYWRTRRDAFAEVWPEMSISLDADPDQTARELLEAFEARYPGQFGRHFRTLQHRVQLWRQDAARRLVFGVADQSFNLSESTTETRGGEDGG